MTIRFNILAVCLSVLILSFPCLVQAEVLKADFSLNATKVAQGVKVPDQFSAANAQAVLTNEFFNGQTNAIVIYFYKGQMKELGKDYDTCMTLFIDKDNKIWQVNMTYVVPGFSAAYTVVWTRKDLESFASVYSFDNDTLQLTSKGSFNKKAAEDDVADITWDVNLTLPVLNQIK